MISQISNMPAMPQGSDAPRLPNIEVQKPAAPVELPLKAVKAIEAVDIDTVKNAADSINRLIQQFARNLEFTVDEDTGIDVVKVVDTESQEVIRQMPTDEMLAIAKALDKLQGMLIKEKV